MYIERMGKAKKAVHRQADPLVVEFIEAAAIGDVRTVKKLAKAGTCEVDAGERAFRREMSLVANASSETKMTCQEDAGDW